MFEPEIESTKLRLAELLLPPGGGSLHLVNILDNPSLDRAYKEFFRAEVEWMLYQDRIQRQTNLPIESSDPLFRSVWEQVEHYVRQHARFDRRAALSLMDTAVKSILNYRVRPRVSLKWFVYRGEPTKPVCEIVLRMQYFADYPYFRAGFAQWLEERELAPESMHIMPMFEFERLIKQLDDDFILDLSTSEFLDLLDPIFSFFNDAATPAAVQAIPIEALIVFLDDKDIQVIAQKFERMLYHDGVRNVTRDMILRVVEQVLQELELQDQANGDVQITESVTIPSTEEELAGDTIVLEQSTAPIDITHEAIHTTVDDREPHQDATAEPPLTSEEAVTQELFDSSPQPSEEQHSEPTVQMLVPSGGPIESQELLADVHQGVQPTLETHDNVVDDAVAHVQAHEDSAVHHPDDANTNPPNANDDVDSTLLKELEAMLAMGSQQDETFQTSTSEERSALEREFQLPSDDNANASLPDDSVAHGEEENLEPNPIQKPVAKPTEGEQQATHVFEGAYTEVSTIKRTPSDALLERGIQQVRVSVKPQHQELRPLREFLSEVRIDQIRSKLCEGIEERMDELLNRLEQALTMRTAMNELDRYLAEFQLDPKSKAAQELRMALVKRFTFKES